LRKPADSGKWQIRENDVPRYPLQATECLLDPCQDPLGRYAIQDVVPDVGNEGSGRTLGKRLQIPP
jgi:hypothetical protein